MDLPWQVYKFNQDTALFQPPEYPEAPKDMYYSVPEKSPKVKRPKPIFPWEEYAPRATRVFPGEQARSPDREAKARSKSPVPIREQSATLEDSQESQQGLADPQSIPDVNAWSNYARANAWDSVPEIERYVQAVTQARQGRVQVLHQADAPSSATLQSGVTAQHPSMRVTDFPTEIERPSLPVTPAPRRPTFWGEERNEAGELPMAEGVPKQQDWVSLSHAVRLVYCIY